MRSFFGPWARRALALLCLLMAATWVPLARAQTEGEVSVARRFYREGLQAEKEGRWQAALTAYQKALEIRNTPQLALRAGICHEQLGQLAQALVVYERALEKARLEQLDKVQQVVGDRLEALRPRVPQLVIVAQDPPEDLSVSLDEEPVAAATFGVELPVDPGEHVVRATAPGHEPFEQRVTLDEGAEKTVALSLTAKAGGDAEPPTGSEVAPPEGAAPTGDASIGDDGAQREASYLPAGLLLGGGGVLVAVGAVLLGLSASKEGDVDGRCGGPERLTCPLSEKEDIESTLDSASTFRAAGFVVGGVGAAAVVTGVVLAIVPPTSGPEGVAIRIAPVGTPLGLGVVGVF